MDFTNFIKPELLVLIPVLFIIGKFLKQIESFKDGFIPITLAGISVALSVIYTFSTCNGISISTIFTCLFTAITQGILCAGASVFTHQLIKQTNKKDE